LRLVRAALFCLLATGLSGPASTVRAQANPRFKVLVLGQPDDNHPGTGAAGIKAVQEIAAGKDYTVDATTDAGKLTDDNLANYQVLMVVMGWQGAWSAAQRNAVEKFVEAGKGWMGFHVSTLAGIYTTPWPWYDAWVGLTTFKGHPGTRQNGTIKLESTALTHPVLDGIPAQFTHHEEWYSWNNSPRGKPDISILATVDESTYDPQGTGMGRDHPVIWSNTKYGPMILTSLGHEPENFTDANVRKLIANAIPWLAKSSSTVVSPTLRAAEHAPAAALRWDGHRFRVETPVLRGAGEGDVLGRVLPIGMAAAIR
jgi:type 1 glutamine amidotransferase